MSLRSMVDALQGAGVRFVVIGGVAGIAHGSRRVTDDLDICYDSALENRKILAGLLAEWGAYPRDLPPGLPFVMDAQTLRNAPVLTLTSREGSIDIFDQVPGVGAYDACAASADWLTVGSQKVRVLGLDALIAAKQATGRAKDLEHLRELTALREIQPDEEPPGG